MKQIIHAGLWLVIVVLHLSSSAFAQTLSSNNGGVTVPRGTELRFSPIPRTVPIDIPPNDQPVDFWLMEDSSGAEWSVQFVLPEFLISLDSADSLPCVYMDSSAYEDRSSTYWNPTIARSFVTDANGSLVIGIVPRTTIPAATRIGSRYGATYLCIARRLSDSLELVQEARLEVEVVSDAPQAQMSDLGLYYLQSGHNYSINPPDGAITPIINGGEVGSLGVFPVLGEPFARVLISFALPEHLAPSSATVGKITCRFDQRSAWWAEGDSFFTPLSPAIVQLDSNGYATIYLGFTAEIFPGSGPDVYQADGIMTAAYVANKYVPSTMSVIGSYAILIQVEIVSHNPVIDRDGWITGLFAGTRYSLLPNNRHVIPLLNGRESGQTMAFPILGDPDARVRVCFILPQRIGGSMSADSVQISFPPNSARWQERDTLFDPTIPFVAKLDEYGVMSVELGFDVEIPEMTRSEIFQTYAILFASYVGNQSLGGNATKSSDSCNYGGVIVPGYSQLLKVEVIADEQPRTYTLHQSYPNPVNGMATIRYDLPAPSEFEIALYSLLGEKVLTIARSFQYAGQHQVTFSTDNLPSGVYFYRLTSGSTATTRKLVIMR